MYEHEMVSDSLAFADPALILEMESCDEEDFDDDTTQEAINMASKKEQSAQTEQQAQQQQHLSPIQALHQLLGGITQYPLQNVLQRTMQSMVTEIARAQHLADRIEVGDEPMFDMGGMRPQVDQNQYERTLSERQYEILVNCQNDEAELIAALVELKNYYVWLFGDEKVTYALAENGRGGWDQISDFKQAVAAEYRKAHQNWVKRQSEPHKEGFTAEGAQVMRETAKARAEKLASAL